MGSSKPIDAEDDEGAPRTSGSDPSVLVPFRPRTPPPAAPASHSARRSSRRPLTHLNIHGHQIRTPLLVFGAGEALMTFALATLVASAVTTAPALVVTHATLSALAVSVAAICVGLYNGHAREGKTGLILRLALCLGVLAPAALAFAEMLLPGEQVSLLAHALTAPLLLVLMGIARQVLPRHVSAELFRNRVLVLGTGREAARILDRMRRQSDRQGFVLLGFVNNGEKDLLEEQALPRFRLADEPLPALCERLGVDEVVIAQDDRRGSDSARLPLQALLDCKMRGILTTELATFFERESGRIDITVLRPSWLVFSPGFAQPIRRTTKRAFDLFTSITLLLLAWPAMLLAALAIKLEDGLQAPVIYSQERVGLGGEPYRVLKFRSMRVDAEKFGQAVWAEKHDPRITRVGRFLRAVRIDELPQLLNVLRGEMAFVGPRPERPCFVERFAREIPFYGERHCVKPGLTGWAQINYPYGACDEDAARKLEFDLYYVKNYSFFLDLLTLLRTVEVVLVGKGAR